MSEIETKLRLSEQRENKLTDVLKEKELEMTKIRASLEEASAKLKEYKKKAEAIEKEKTDWKEQLEIRDARIKSHQKRFDDITQQLHKANEDLEKSQVIFLFRV